MEAMCEMKRSECVELGCLACCRAPPPLPPPPPRRPRAPLLRRTSPASTRCWSACPARRGTGPRPPWTRGARRHTPAERASQHACKAPSVRHTLHMLRARCRIRALREVRARLLDQVRGPHSACRACAEAQRRRAPSPALQHAHKPLSLPPHPPAAAGALGARHGRHPLLHP